MFLQVFSLVFLSVVASTNGVERYDNYVVLRVHADSAVALQYVRALQHQLPGSELWSEGNGRDIPTDLMVAPSSRALAEGKLQVAGVRYEVMVENVQKLIDAEREEMVQARGGKALNLESFNSYQDISTWLEQMSAAYPSLASVQEIGKTYENREMKLIKIGTDPSKPIVWIDGGIHAREWISPATVIWFINKLLTTYSTDSEIKTLVDSLNWYILPVHNPDGYEYSRSSSRLWRKTRFPTKDSSIFTGRCYGVDPNRNFNAAWGTTGISTSGCSDVYCGPEPHSEPCVKNVVEYLGSLGSDVKIYLSFHSYSQLWMIPYSYTYSRAADYAELNSLAGVAVAALRAVYGTSYRYGQVPDLLYTASGSSMDWAYDEAGIKYSFTVELRDTGRYGFIPPASEIRPSGEETWAGVKALVNAIMASQ